MTAHESTDGRESQTETSDASTTQATVGGRSHADERSAGGATTNRSNTAGLEANVAGAAAYAIGWLTGLFFFFTEKEDEYVRFHAAQSIVAFGALTVVSFLLQYVLVGMVFSTFSFGL